jgi:hypothetical protein
MAPLTRRTGAAKSRALGLHWLLQRQNSNGGWGAFDQDNVGSRLAKLFAKNLTDSVELFDGSSADNTGHVLAGLGACGLTSQHSRAVRRAVRFLRRAQGPQTGLWEGRWGINTFYGTTQAGTGPLRAGESPQSSYLLKAARTLMSFQNPDGGFGESTLSYLDDDHHGRGTSTPTQTAWVLEFLCELGLQEADIGKGRKERCTPMTKSSVTALKSWLKESAKGSEQWLFCTARGERLSHDAVQDLLAKYQTVAGQICPSLLKKRVTPHVLRHTLAMDLLQAGIDQTVIALWLGHESLDTTKVYLDADLALKERILSKTANHGPGRYRFKPDDSLLAFLKNL